MTTDVLAIMGPRSFALTGWVGRKADGLPRELRHKKLTVRWTAYA